MNTTPRMNATVLPTNQNDRHFLIDGRILEGMFHEMIRLRCPSQHLLFSTLFMPDGREGISVRAIE